MSDQRRHPRIAIRQRVWCEGQNVTLYVQALNVSEGGLFVRTANPPTAGHRFRVSFTDLADEEVVATVEVMWSRRGSGDQQPGMGLRIVSFEAGSDVFARYIQEQIEHATPDPDP